MKLVFTITDIYSLFFSTTLVFSQNWFFSDSFSRMKNFISFCLILECVGSGLPFILLHLYDVVVYCCVLGERLSCILFQLQNASSIDNESSVLDTIIPFVKKYKWHFCRATTPKYGNSLNNQGASLPWTGHSLSDDMKASSLVTPKIPRSDLIASGRRPTEQ